ncbi:MAG: GNAT family N-acetyltransferase [Chloroflexi bacterium]|nr:GNAT family N-acetyltransferase [Chloroflexota bacterium]MBP8056287.1 GNAT family N-acetyltransferase [Chloroflexota bacterium]
MNLSDIRYHLHILLDERQPADAIESYYAFHHPDNRTTLLTLGPEQGPMQGYIAFSQTGFDLFRPMVTWRLPIQDVEQSATYIYQAMPPGASVILVTPTTYLPLIQALFTIEKEEHLHLLGLDRGRYEPVINVLVTQAESGNEWPRYVIRAANNTIAASALLNWESRYFAEIGVHTQANYRGRGWGRSVVAALCQYVLERGRVPLYAVNPTNAPSLSLAERVGFADTGARVAIVEATLRPRP